MEAHFLFIGLEKAHSFCPKYWGITTRIKDTRGLKRSWWKVSGQVSTVAEIVSDRRSRQILVPLCLWSKRHCEVDIVPLH